MLMKMRTIPVLSSSAAAEGPGPDEGRKNQRLGTTVPQKIQGQPAIARLLVRGPGVEWKNSLPSRPLIAEKDRV